MNEPALGRLKNLLRLTAWLLAALALLGPLAAAALAQAPAEPEAALSETPSFLWQVISNLFNSRALMETLSQPQYAVAAFLVLNLIVFTETGLLVGFFLPGDSLMVTAGLIASNPLCDWSLPLLLVTLCCSAIVGDTVGYAIGFKTGPKIFTREKSLFFSPKHLLRTKDFYDRHGGKTIIIARFMPIVRTFAPVVAGVGQMNYRRFVGFNVIGGVGWVWSMSLLGYFLGRAVPDIDKNIHVVIAVVIFLSILPGIIEWLRNRGRAPQVTPGS